MFRVLEKLLNLSNRINRFNLAMFVVVWILQTGFFVFIFRLLNLLHA